MHKQTLLQNGFFFETFFTIANHARRIRLMFLRVTIIKGEKNSLYCNPFLKKRNISVDMLFFRPRSKKKTNSVFFRLYSNKRAFKLETFFFRQSVAVFAHIKISILSCFFFSRFQKRILINFDWSNMRELFGIARTQTNLNKMKGESDGKRRASRAIWLKKSTNNERNWNRPTNQFLIRTQ